VQHRGKKDMTRTRHGDRLVKALTRLAPQDGVHMTALEGVEAMRASRPMDRTAVLYKSGIVLIAQGVKRGFIGGTAYEYSPDTYLVLASPLPLEVELVHASPDKPALCLFIGVDTGLLGNLAHTLDEVTNGGPGERHEPPRAVFSTPFDDRILDAATRLADALLDPLDAHMLGESIRREIVYRTLLGPQAHALRALLERDSAASRIAGVLQQLHAAPQRSVSVGEMAHIAGMSVSAFHAAFKAATSMAPIQYHKAMRLHRAQSLMAFDGKRVSEAAFQVGYVSPSQFSRDYKRLFGLSPREGRHAMVAAMEAQA
jgi:AraC-like DNA-binding protein